ncbi:AAA family ATPase [Candidatus Nomurabacteria bacterium]|nr:AAA family ATPase [Lewinellaceae bacterium]MCB9811272.1 AAA family ATPase [Candidatus Nomurabacteria bacterium]
MGKTFEEIISMPSDELQERLANLVGLDTYKDKLIKILTILLNPDKLQRWFDKNHPNANNVSSFINRKPPLIILEGDVGCGKTELGTSIGDSVARKEKIEILLYPMSLSSRGEGRVGEMTQLITSGFDEVIEMGKKFLSKTSKKARGAVILLVDEADSLAQSRENNQMHHEDKAGVNAFIRGIDRMGYAKIPAATILCTNRINSIDPALRRRATLVLSFKRPDQQQRFEVLKNPLGSLGLTEKEILDISNVDGSEDGTIDYTFTMSDIIQRLLPEIIIDAFPDSPVTYQKVKSIVSSMKPTPPFHEQ